MTAARLIALTGYAGSGKSTLADILACEHGFTVVKFAGPLKAMLRALGLDEREIEGDLKEQPCQLLAGHTPRRAMQTLGTEWGRVSGRSMRTPQKRSSCRSTGSPTTAGRWPL
jgi:hypothetical protein